jgi:hypothetical protein
MSEMEKLLDRVAAECSETTADYEAIRVILKRRLLSLLDAGEAMRNDWHQFGSQPKEAWDAAKKVNE